MIWKSKRSVLFQGIYVTDKSIVPLDTHDIETTPRAQSKGEGSIQSGSQSSLPIMIIWGTLKY